MDVLDAVLVVVLVVAALHGLRVGAVAQLLSFAGFATGLALGVVLVLVIEPHLQGQLLKAVLALVLLFVPAAIVGGVGRQIGAGAWRALRRIRVGRVDSVLGAVLALGGTLVACWLFASVLVNSAYLGLTREISSSRILQAVERVMPPVPDAFATVERYLSADGFPQVLVNVLPEPVGPVHLPAAGAVRVAISRAGASTVKVVAIGCGQEQEGSGFVVSDTRQGSLVVTNAHVVAGTGAITVLAPDGSSSRATPVLFDPKFDLAVLRTAPLGEPALDVAPGYVERGAATVVLGYPGGGAFDARPAGVLTRFEAEGRDIYDTALTVRTVYELQAVVRPGNSGGPLVSTSGTVLGVVFSRSATNPDIGYALASPGVLSRVLEAERHPARAGTGSCTG
ncbi:MAG TPA: MarP family serine protease [Acidimicrobiales bacterium]|nr:MarP family serine protease [Acidimicrobiales bacterium]